MAQNPLRIDPTRTASLRRRCLADMQARLNRLKRAIVNLVDTEDAFGLRADAVAASRGVPQDGQNTTQAHVVYTGPVSNTRWRFVTDDAKLAAYQTWLQEQVKAGLLQVSGPNQDTPWLEPYIKSAYKQGAMRAYIDAHAAGIAAETRSFDFVEGGKAAFLESSFNAPTAQAKLRMLNTRAYSQLKGVTAQMDQEMSRILTQGIAAGKNPRALARELAKNVDTLGKKRALVIARTEIVHAHAEGQLDSFEAQNIDGVGVMAEWSTATDAKVCPVCTPLEGIILTVKEARGLIPRHPNCRCAWVPANVGEHIGGTTKTTWSGPEQGLSPPGTAPTGKTTGQVWAKDIVESRMRKSIKAEHPKLGAAAARAKSRWVGADLTTISGKLKPGSAAALAAEEAAAAEQAAAAKAVRQAAKAKAAARAEAMKVALAEEAKKKAEAEAAAAAAAAQEAAKAEAQAMGEAAAAKAQGWHGPGIGADTLDHADFNDVPGWAVASGGKTQSYGVIMFDDMGNVLMREPTGHYGGAHWTFAKGGGSLPGSTAVKEVGEETGHIAAIHDILPGSFKGKVTKTNFFLGKSVGYDAGLMDTETAAVKWMSYDEALQAIQLSKSSTVVARDTAILKAAFKQMQESDGSAIAALAKGGAAKLDEIKKAAAAAEHSHKVKIGMAQAHYAKEKFGGGVTADNWVNPANKTKLAPSGLNKVLSEKGWHITTLPADTAEKLIGADDVVAQKAMMDALKKAPKGTPLPGVPQLPVQTKAASHVVTKADFAGDVPQGYELDAAMMKGATEEKQKIFELYVNWDPNHLETLTESPEKAARQLNKFKAAFPELYGGEPLPKVVPVKPAFAVPLERDLTKVKDLPGSTEPYLAKDKAGKLWVVKDPGNGIIKPDHLRSEGQADELYRTLGFNVPRGAVVDTPSGPLKITEYLEGGQTLGAWQANKTTSEIKAMYKQIQEGFVADALFANHDVAGMTFDNIFIVGNKAYRIDNGGALAYRAQGLKKQGWGGKVLELASMRDASTNAQTAAIYKGITEAEIQKQIKYIVAHRIDILAAMPDDEVRAVLAARIDDLASKLPAQVAADIARNAPGGARRAEYAITPDTAKRVQKAKSNGVTLAADRGDIEDTNILVWEEMEDGKPVTWLQLKTTKAGSDRIRATIGDELARAKGSAPGSYSGAVSNVHPDDHYWDTIKKAGKTVAYHAGDGAYNQGTLSEYAVVKLNIEYKLKTATGDAKKMLEHYKDACAAIDEGIAAKKAPKILFQYVHKPAPVEASEEAVPRRAERALRAQFTRKAEYRTAKFEDGVGTVGNSLNRIDVDEHYIIDAGDGIEIRFTPSTGAVKDKDGLALEGVVSVKLTSKADEDAIRKAVGVLNILGLDTAAPDPAYEELLYLHRSIYLRGKAKEATYTAIMNDALATDEQKVLRIREWVKKNMGIDVTKVKDYNPHGITKHVDGSGFRYWNRWDLPPEEIAKAMPDYALCHTTGGLGESPYGAIPNTLDAILSSAGEFTSTLGRIRKGVLLGSVGASSEYDITTGGASYFFTRIKKEGANTHGFYFRIGALGRQDAVSYDDDKFGSILKLNQRASTVEKYKEFEQHRRNESIFKEGLSIDDLDFIRAHDTAERDQIIAVFKKHGMTTLPDGRKVEDIVVVGTEVPKARRRA